MKNLLLVFALLISSIAFSQKPVLDSIEVYKALPAKPELVVTIYDYENLYVKMTEKSDELGLNEFIAVFFYKEDENGPQKTLVKNFKRNID